MNTTHPLNVIKYCPRCGSNDFPKAGERSFKCKACGFHFFINSVAAVACLVSDSDGRLMLATRGIEPHYGKLDLPGGFIDPLETAEHAVKRELKEELGLDVTEMEYLGSAPNEYVFSGFTVFTLDMGFKVKAKSLENLQAKDDILDFNFYSEEELNYDDIPAPSIKHFVREYFKNRS